MASIVESSTMLLRTVSSAEFENFKQSEITWFTGCNDFTPIYKDDPNHFEVCIAGLNDKRLFFDERYGIFMFLNQDTKNTKQTTHLPMNMKLVSNVRKNSFKYASLFCDWGHLHLETHLLGIGAETLLRIEE